MEEILRATFLLIILVGLLYLWANPADKGASIFVGAIAISVPFLVNLITKAIYRPKLNFIYKHKPYYARQTKWKDKTLVYYFKFEVKNEGKSQAKLCEAVLEDLCLFDNSGRPVREENFSPVNLTWSEPYKSQFVDINPNRVVSCDIGHINQPGYEKEKSVYYKYYPNEDDKKNKFFFDIKPKLHAQRDCVAPGTVKIKIGIYADNALKREKEFEIKWSGKWKDKEKDMLREIVITPQ